MKGFSKRFSIKVNEYIRNRHKKNINMYKLLSGRMAKVSITHGLKAGGLE